MTAINPVTELTIEGDIGVLTLNAPPVNALSDRVRQGIVQGMAAAVADPATKAVVLICEGGTFIAGADITEFSGGATMTTTLVEAQDAIESSSKPVVAAIHGAALGGGLEIALVCHYRVAVPSARCGLPEVNIGLLPGAGGTQRLPRVVGVEKALAMVTTGQPVSAMEGLDLGLIDELVPERRLREGALAFARKVLAESRPLRRIRDENAKVEAARDHFEVFETVREAGARKFRGFMAPENNIKAVEAAVNLPFDEGLAEERRLFMELMAGDQAAAQQYYFFAERRSRKIPDVPDDTQTLPVASVGVIGAGTMGGGIAMTFANAGLPVTLVETGQEALDRGLAAIRGNYERTAARGGLTAAHVEARMGLISGSLDINDLAQLDLVVEAVFELMEVKQEVFGKLDAICKPGAILASNTSYLDFDKIAQATKRPDSVIGLHFFSPANVMKLLEVVRGAATSKAVIATAMKLGRTIGKIPVLVGAGHGFVGNRMLGPRQREADALALEGAMPWDVDRVLYDFGFPMGPFAMADLAGLDLGWVRETSSGSTLREVLCEMDRRGQKAGAGFYDYDAGRNATPSPVTEAVIEAFAARSGVTPRRISDQEILERTVYSMINEGAKILEEGIAIRPSDIDVIWVNGYGWPVYRGGPMYYADQVGLGKVLAAIKAYQARLGDAWKPAALLEKLVSEGKGFGDLR